MKNRYFDLIDQTFYFPQEGFDIFNGYLTFHGMPLIHIIEKYGTPLKLTYLPKIGDQIKRAKNLFNRAIKAGGYRGTYNYCYCTKCCHFSYVLEEVLKHDVELETSSAFDIDLIVNLYKKGLIDKNKIIVNNGFKTQKYIENIAYLINEGFKNVIPVMDNTDELKDYDAHVKKSFNIGIR